MPAHTLKCIYHFVTIIVVGSMFLAGCASTASRPAATASSSLSQTVYSDDGVSELSTPATWAVRPDFGQDAAIRVAEARGAAFLVVNSYFPGEIEATPISEFSQSYAEGLAESLPNSKTSRGQSLNINGASAHRYIVTGDVGGLRLTYVSTVVSGSTAMHHLIGWVAASRYSSDGDVLNQVISSFRESPSPRPARERIALNFAWPDSLESAVNFHQKSVKRGKTFETKATYLTTVRPGDPNELIVSTRVIRQDVAGSSDEESNNYMGALMKQVVSEVPDYVVSRNGEFMRVDNISAFQQRVENAVLSNLPHDIKNQQKDKILAMVRPSLSEQFLVAAVTDEWNKTVGGWAGSSYVPGQTYNFNEQYYAPSLGATPFGMVVSRRIAGFAPCTSSQTQCVKLILTATVAGEDFRSAMKQFLEKTAGQPVKVKQLSVVKKMEIIAEPDTLIPHRSRSIKETTVTIEDSKGKTRTSRDTEDTRVTYSYETYSASQ